jgi:diguanylate cyclase
MEAHNQALENQLRSTSSEISQLREEVETTRREASTDGLTGIANRKMFDSRVLDAVAEATETGTPMALMMLDIDHFKKFNDAHGHQIGDQVLILLARTLEESTKGKDTAARYGGEEFAVILPETGLTQAITLADKIRQRLASKKIVNRKTGDFLGTITLSIGVAQFKSGESVATLVARADAAMYEAKNTGRNRVTSEQDLRQSHLELDN